MLEGVAAKALRQGNGPSNNSGRRIGYHFAKIGLLADAFEPLCDIIRRK